MTSHTPSGHPVAVDRTYYYQPMASCPRGQKVTLLTQYGIATHGQFDGKDTQFIGWAPLPKVPSEMKGLMK